MVRQSLVASVLVTLLGVAGCARQATESDAAEGPTVQVIPFEVEGQDEGANAVGQAFAQSVALTLTRADDTRVVGLPAGLAGTVGGDTRPTRVVSGVVHRTGRSVQVQAELRDPADERSLWQTEMTSDHGSLSKLAAKLAREAIDTMDVSYPKLYGSIDDLSPGGTLAGSPLWLEAQDWRRYDTEGRLQATAELIARHSDEPPAHVLHAWALTLAWDAERSSESLLVELRSGLEELNRVDPSSPYDEFLRAYVYRSSGAPDHALELYSRILGRNDLTHPARAWALRQRSLTQLQLGNATAARLDAEQAVTFDPVNAASLISLSKSLEILGELDEAIAVSQRALILEPAVWRHQQRLGLVLARAGRLDEAVASMERACEMGQTQEACANLAVTLQRAGRTERARTTMNLSASLSATPFGLYNIACYKALAGERDAALAELKRSIELGFADVLIHTDTDLDALRDDPQFDAIETEVENRINVRRNISGSVFPWQA